MNQNEEQKEEGMKNEEEQKKSSASPNEHGSTLEGNGARTPADTSGIQNAEHVRGVIPEDVLQRAQRMDEAHADYVSSVVEAKMEAREAGDHVRAQADFVRGGEDAAVKRLHMGLGFPPSDAVSFQNQSAQSMLEGLLAIIHGDGGHYTKNAGLEKSAEDAVARIRDLQSIAIPEYITDQYKAMIANTLAQFPELSDYGNLPKDENGDKAERLIAKILGEPGDGIGKKDALLTCAPGEYGQWDRRVWRRGVIFAVLRMVRGKPKAAGVAAA